MYRKDQISNGLRIVTHDIPQRDSISLGFWIGVGGRYESDKLKGAAHFLEHIVFKGSKKYSCEEIKEKIEGVGGALNAFTSEEQTCFYAKIPSKHLEQAFEVLADMVFFPRIVKRDVAKEKGVIIEEIKMYHDLPQYFCLELLDQLVWPNHPLGKSLAGTPDSVMAMSNDDLKGFHKQFYCPSNIVISASGNVKHAKLLKLVKAKLGKIKRECEVDFERASIKQTEPKLRFYKKDIEQMHLAVGLPGYDENHKDRYVLSLLNVILGGNMSSRLFVELREKRGLAYSISSCAKQLHDTGLFMIRAGVESNKIVDSIKLIKKELHKVRKNGISVSEFTRAREYVLGQLVLNLEDTMDHMLWLGESYISKNRIRTLKNVISDFEKIKKSDVKRVANEIIDDAKFNVALVGPVTKAHEKQISALFGLL